MGDIHYFLEIEVKHTTEGKLYVNDLLAKAKMKGCKPYATPLPSSIKLFAIGCPPFEDPSLYKSVVVSLQYVTITRP